MKSLSKQQHSIAKLWSLKRRKKWLLIKVLLILITYKGVLSLFPFKRFMMHANGSTPQKVGLSEELINEVVWAVHLVSSKFPLGFTCLIQALAAKWLLKDQPDVYICIGVRKSKNENFSAHAWIIYRNKIVLGEQLNQFFEPILEWN
jgi:Transglutaminase-like superfamily